tara:strand:+ start:6190 stop:6510 length:321 start_codon:yes stop_codon:yes gene_type:complete
MTEPSVVFTREMGITHREYLRTLQRAVEGRTYTAKDGGGTSTTTINIDDGTNHVEIILPPQRLRKIGNIQMKLPITDVEFRFFGHTQEQAQAVMERFEIYYRRGGG